MAVVRAILQGTVSDYPAFVANAKRACASVSANEPDTLSYECFADEESGAFVWHEVYTDANALVTHVNNAFEGGIGDEFMRLVELKGISILGEVSDPAARELLDQFGAMRLSQVAALER